MSHTPGPWQLEGNWRGKKNLGGYVSTMHPQPVFELVPILGEPGEIIANAHLLSAAPDLLLHLKRLVRFAEDAPRCDFNEDKTLSWLQYEIAEATKAIAKAEPSNA